MDVESVLKSLDSLDNLIELSMEAVDKEFRKELILDLLAIIEKELWDIYDDVQEIGNKAE